MPEGCAGRGEKRFRLLDEFHALGWRGRLRDIFGRQAFDLLDVEDGVALHERDRLVDFLALVVLAGLVKRVGVDDERAMLALADVSAQRLRLAISHPEI